MPVTNNEPFPSQLPPRFKLLELLGEGSMGRVHKVLDRHSNLLVALKTLQASSPEDCRRFEREARTLSQLRHENIVRLFEIGTAADQVFFTMEFLHGIPLSAFLNEPPPKEETIKWLMLVALKLINALEYIHQRGVLHRDLKPSNVMILFPEELHSPEAQDVSANVKIALAQTDPGVKLLDFGLAIERETTRRGGIFAAGTPLYMSPEQLAGTAVIDERSDLYSAGALLYHLVSGKPPFPNLAEAFSRRKEPIPPHLLNPGCSLKLSQTLLNLLEREPHRRPAGAAELGESILCLLERGRQRTAIKPKLVPPTFVGRSAELERLRELLRLAGAGKGKCIQVPGERGAGKTWLLQQSGLLGEALVDLGLAPVRGTFVRGGALHQGLRELLEELLALMGAGVASREVNAENGGGGSLEPWVSDVLASFGLHAACEEPPAPPDPGPQAAPERIVEAATRVLRQAVAARPLVVVLEDLQYADELEISLLSRWARMLEDLPLALIVTYRPESVRGSGPLERWLKEVETDGRVSTVAVGALTDGELRQLAEQMLRPAGRVSEPLLAALARASEGRPLALIRWLQFLWQRGALQFESGVWNHHETDEGRVSHYENAWVEHLKTLTPRELEILAAAVVLGTPFEENLLAEILEDGVDPSPLERAPCPPALERNGGLRSLLRSLAARGFLAESAEGFAPPPDLDEKALGARIPQAELQSWHARAASGLLRFYGEAAETHFFGIGVHFHRAGELESARKLYTASARYAASMYANRKGIEAYSLAMELCAPPGLKAEIAEELGDLYARVGDYPGALRCFRLANDLNARLEFAATDKTSAASSLGEEERARRLETEIGILDRIGRVLQRQGEFEEALAHFSRCLEKGKDLHAVRARSLFRIGSIHLERADLAAARGHLEESLGLYEALGDFGQIAEVQSHLGLVEKYQDRLEQAIARFEKAKENAEKSGNLVKVATTLNNLGNLHRAHGDDHRAIDCLARSIEVRERIGDRQGLAICLNNIAQVHSYRGEVSPARKSTEAALKIFEEVGDPKGVIIARANLGGMMHLQGEFKKAREFMVESLDMAKRWQMQRYLERTLCHLGLLEIDFGRYNLAVDYLQQCLRTLPGDQPSEIRALTLGALAAAQIRLHDFEPAQDAIREALEIAAELKLREKLGALVTSQVRLHLERGDPEVALQIGKPVLAAEEGGMERQGAASLRRELGRVYRELGPDWADQTQKHLEVALTEFQRMGSPHNVAETQAELAIFWRLLGEEEEARLLFQAAEENFSRIGATLRLEELMAARGVA